MTDLINYVVNGDLETIIKLTKPDTGSHIYPDRWCLTYSSAFGRFDCYRYFIDNFNIPITQNTAELIIWNLSFGYHSTNKLYKNKEYNIYSPNYEFYRYLQIPNDNVSRKWWVAHLEHLKDEYKLELPIYLSDYVRNKSTKLSK